MERPGRACRARRRSLAASAGEVGAALVEAGVTGCSTGSASPADWFVAAAALPLCVTAQTWLQPATAIARVAASATALTVADSRSRVRRRRGDRA